MRPFRLRTAAKEARVRDPARTLQAFNRERGKTCIDCWPICPIRMTTPPGDQNAWKPRARHLRLNPEIRRGIYCSCRPQLISAPRSLGWERSAAPSSAYAGIREGAGLRIVRHPPGAQGKIRHYARRGHPAVAGNACELVGAMLHPLNRPEYDTRKKIVKSGRAFCSAHLGGAGSRRKSLFSRVCAGHAVSIPIVSQ